MALVLAATTEAAAPRYIMVSGPSLPRPVLLTDWKENHALLLAVANARRARPGVVQRLDDRPRLRVGLFWGWAGERPPKRQNQADRSGWFYPFWRSQPAVVHLLVNGKRFPRIAPVRVLRILDTHGIPTRLTPPSPPPSAEAPTLCHADEVETVVKRFVAAFNAGDLDGLDAIFAREPEFEWYTTGAPGERQPTASHDRSSLISYFAARHAVGERLALRSFQFNGNGRRPHGNFQYTLTRSADDLAPTRYIGKGAALCYRERADSIFVWSMAPEHP